MEQDLLSDLTAAQREAVTHFEGPLLILAGAGSGKTRVITRRVAWLLQQGVRPHNILAITFTNKAAGEMRQRVDALMPGNKVWISTFHALGARLLRQYGDRLSLDRNFTIYDQDDRNRLVKVAMEDAQITEGKFSTESLQSAISKAKNQLLSPDRYAMKAHDFYSQTVAKVYPIYEKRLRDSNALDFDDLLYWPALAMKHNAELRAELDARFRFVLIDEYQDTNQAQYALARGLSVDFPNLCVVGDPDQCLPPGTMIPTPKGLRPIEKLREGEEVLSASGWGKLTWMPLEKVMVNPFKGKLVRLRLEGGSEFRATPNHICFVAFRSLLPLPRYSGGEGWGEGVFSSQCESPPLPQPLSPEYRGEGRKSERIPLASNTSFDCTRADNINPGMIVPVRVGDHVEERRVQSVEWEDYEGPVYDLSVPVTRNFVANDLVVHNSIYGWRGSDIRNILDFERDFPSARVLTLSQNYRSTKSILFAASTLIAHNRDRKPKDLITDNANGVPVTCLTFENGSEEATGVARRIRQAVEQGDRKFRDFAIFLRINALSRSLETAFAQERVKFQIVRGLAFFDRKENRDILAYLRLLLNPRDDLSFLRVVNEPTRGVGKVSLEHLKAYAEPREMPLLAAAADFHKISFIKGKAAAGLRDFTILMRELQPYLEAPPDEVIKQVIDLSGYRKMLRDSSDSEDQERLANIEELITAAHQFAAEDATRTVSDFLENITLASDVDSWDEEQDCVSIMTFHAAKGLEFPVVYMMAVEQGILPHERSLSKTDQLEEERRLAFVGMTRAKEELYLCHSRMREFRGNTLYAIPSMFLSELPLDSIRTVDTTGASLSAMDRWRHGGGSAAQQGWQEAGVTSKPVPIPSAPRQEDTTGPARGDVVKHEKYGEGQVLEVSGWGAMRKIRIRFRTAGERTFFLEKATLEIVKKA